MRITTIKITFCLISFFASFTAFALDTSLEEKTCIDIGFKRKTEAFGNCVIELVNRSSGSGSRHGSQQSSSTDPDDATCRKYGFRAGTNEYAQCKQQIDIARSDAQRQQAQFDQQQKQYQDQLDAQRRRRSDAANMAMLGVGLGMMAGDGGQGASVGPAPITPQKPMNDFRTYSLPNGQSMRCNTFGSNTQCF
jgi:hypothetical protein